MPKICYADKNFRDTSLDIIYKANKIIEDYMQQGLKLTLRQLYYRFVAADLLPDDRTWMWTGSKWVRDPNGTKNAQPNYKWLGTLLNDARLAGLIDWEAIEDRGRNLNTISSWNSPASIIRTAANSYAIDKWKDQEHRIEVWVEKEALEAIIQNAAEEYDVPSFACKGYTSQSAMWEAAQRLLKYADNGQIPVIIHLGDHDPSGIDMTRDIADRLNLFGVGLDVNRIALNMDQVEKYDPPPNPAKITDSRAKGYINRFGYESWELDALEPAVLKSLIQDTIKMYMDVQLYNEAVEKEDEQCALLNKVSAQWGWVVDSLK